MGTEEVKPAFYALRAGGWRDYVTVLHLPYTAWTLAYVALGAALAPVFHTDRMVWTMAARTRASSSATSSRTGPSGPEETSPVPPKGRSSPATGARAEIREHLICSVSPGLRPAASAR